MAENTNETAEKTQKTSKFAELKAEFHKIVWPDKQSIVRQTTAVVVISVVLGLIITLLDYVIQYGIDILVKL
ncbi:MAG: preprotein translocase subunit SecE [Lachnospiraceae bacterium]